MRNVIDLPKFIQAFVYENAGPAAAYRRAGYEPEGDKDNAALLANRYLKRPEVQAAIDEAHRDRRALAKNLTLNGLIGFLESELSNLEPKDRGKFLLDAADKLGVSAPKSQDSMSAANLLTAAQALARLQALANAHPGTAKIIDITPGEGTDASSGSSETPGSDGAE